MNANTQKRLECAWLLKDAAWALKRLADRYERCCMHDANDEDESKAQVWVDRAKERLNKFRASRAEYLGPKPKAKITWDDIIRMLEPPLPKRNPWRAGFLDLLNVKGVVKVFFGPGDFETWDMRYGGFFNHIGAYRDRHDGDKPLAWRPS